MAETPSNKVAIGTLAPDFELHNPKLGKPQKLNEIKGENGTLIMFICNHCPFVKNINSELVRLSSDFSAKGIGFIAINSNDVDNYPEDSPEKMIEYGDKLGYNFPYLFDEDQQTAKAYDAACTPDFYLYDGGLRLYYHGQLDGSRPGNEIPVNGKDIRDAIESMLDGKKPPAEQQPSIGCNIKWKKKSNVHWKRV